VRIITPSTDDLMTANPVPEVHGTSGRRWQLVDMLRGIAILLVLFRHHQTGGPLQVFGWMGVDLFFVLSGFLVSGLIFDEYRRTRTFLGTRFLIRRGFKIYPSFYVFILLSPVAMTLTGKKMSVLNYVAEVFFIQNYFPGVWFHTWSLAVEEHFYFTLVIIASLLIVCKVRFNLRSMIIACIILSLFFLGFRMASWLERPGLFGTHFVATHLRMDSLLGGVLLAALHRYRPEPFLQFFRNHRWLLVFCIVLLLLPTLLEPFGSFIMITFGLSGVYLAGTLAVGLAVTATPLPDDHPVQRWWVRPVSWVGGISYNTYLWHLFVLMTVGLVTTQIGLRGTVAEFVIYALLSIAVGFLATRIIERPFLHWRERWFPARSRP